MHILKCWLLIFHENDWKKRSKVFAVNVFNKLTCPGFPISPVFPRWKEKNEKSTFNLRGLPNGTSKNVGLGKFWQDLEISEAFLISLEVLFFHGLFLLF